MKLEQLSRQLSSGNQHPPIEQWQPVFCGDIDIHIHADGSWDHMGSPINRQSLVKLLASVLIVEDQQYFLITPQEKMRITVDDAPFVVTQWRHQPSSQGDVVVFTTNVGDQFPLSEQYSLAPAQPEDRAPVYLHIHRQLLAALHRNVYYQLAELASHKTVAGCRGWYITSAGRDFCLATD